MIRIYFDSDVINNFRIGKFPELDEFIKNNRDKLLIPFSQAHISDKLPSKSIKPDVFCRDIDFITQFTQRKLLIFDEKKGLTVPQIASAKDVLEDIEESNEMIDKFSSIDNILNFLVENAEDSGVPELGSYFKELMEQTSFDIDTNEYVTVKEVLQKSSNFVHSLLNNPQLYKENRNQVQEDFKLTSNSGNWDTGVIDKIDKHLKHIGKSDSFLKLVENSFEDKSKKNLLSFFTLAYQYLNLVGYKADSINNTGIKNHIQDATHAFFAGHCDFLISMDKKLIAKTNAIYEKFNIQTKVLKPEELQSHLETILIKKSISNIVNDTLKKDAIESLLEDGVIKKLYRIDNYFLEYFTHLQIESERNLIIFSKLKTNYSNFLFYEEHDSVIRNFHIFLGLEKEADSVIEKFKNKENNENNIHYKMDDTIFYLESDGKQLHLFISFPKTS